MVFLDYKYLLYTTKTPVIPIYWWNVKEDIIGNQVISLYRIIENTLFSSPEPKARVSYCHSAPSIVRRPSFRPSIRPSSVNFHIFDFFSRTAWWILMKLGRDELLMVPYKCCCFSARSPQGRIQGGAKISHMRSTSSRNFFFRPEGYSDKPNA